MASPEDPREAGRATIDKSLPEEFACHSRTVRRDLQALEVRFPLYTDTVDGPVRWKLVEGFNRVPALQFSATELMALVFTRDLAKPLEGTPIKESIDSALVKIEGALPAAAEEFVQNLHSWFSAGVRPHKTYAEHREAAKIRRRAFISFLYCFDFGADAVRSPCLNYRSNAMP